MVIDVWWTGETPTNCHNVVTGLYRRAVEMYVMQLAPVIRGCARDRNGSYIFVDFFRSGKTSFNFSSVSRAGAKLPMIRARMIPGRSKSFSLYFKPAIKINNSIIRRREKEMRPQEGVIDL
jgi:hypothetical protein